MNYYVIELQLLQQCHSKNKLHGYLPEAVHF